MGGALAAAAPALVITNLNMRQGPGTNFGIITTIPGGSTVDVTGCTGEWCNVVWGGMGGYAVARNLDLGGPGTGAGCPGPGRRRGRPCHRPAPLLGTALLLWRRLLLWAAAIIAASEAARSAVM